MAWGCFWPVAVAVFLLRRNEAPSSATRVLQVTWLVVAGAVLFVFVVTPYQIDYHLHTAFRRLWLHLYPLASVLTAEHLWATGWLARLAAAIARYADAQYARAPQDQPTASPTERRTDRTAA